ncbi:restriction endonuclease [Micromonospora sp. 4G55]|uniref:restriction endonuclease n=1 Tax=Micromonospora sp. 4G55 TaxID=2806102 RepID=UPI001A5B4FB9|nr:restriction endonuclease [Micromonospora sp. 4G55]MBM0256472.1 restriction endonuclease [Micromonospora sp. 4G55]
MNKRDMSDLAGQLLHWLNAVLNESGDDEPTAHVSFPSDELLAEYLKDVDDRSEEEVKSLLRTMLSATTSQADTTTHRLLHQMLQEGNRPPDLTLAESYLRIERKLRYGVSDAWEGVTWALEMLPFKPGKCLRALNLYLEAQHGLPDLRIHAISDAAAIIRARWVSSDSSHAGRIDLLKTLSPRIFEALTASLWEHLGYDVSLTKSQGDGGFDLRAEEVSGERRDVALVECKLRSDDPVGVEIVRALNGILDHEKSVRGVIVTTTRFTRGAIAFARDNPRLNLLDADALVPMLNEHLGLDWHKRVDIFARAFLQGS